MMQDILDDDDNEFGKLFALHGHSVSSTSDSDYDDTDQLIYGIDFDSDSDEDITTMLSTLLD